jgi:uncharacterized protein YyaL (SSP411 family)
MAVACERFFWDEGAGAFYDAASDAPPLVTRPRDAFDNAMPSGTALAVDLLQRLTALDGSGTAAACAARALSALTHSMQQVPTAFGHLLGAADASVDGMVSVVLSGAAASAELAALQRTVAARYVPAMVLASGSSDGVPLAAGKRAPAHGAMAYVCRGFSCDTPTSDPDELSRQLANAVRS